MNKCKICNTEFEGNTCPNCGNSILSNEKQIKKDNQSYILAIISLALTGLSFFSGVLTVVIHNIDIAPVSIIISAISFIAGLILAIISIVNAKTKRAISICALVMSIVWLIVMLLIVIFLVTTAIIAMIACASCGGSLG